MQRLNRFALNCALLVATSTVLPPATAQNYPSRPIRLIVAVAPGGNLDMMGRAAAAALTEGLGRQVVVENRPGANSTIGADHVAREPQQVRAARRGTAGQPFAGALHRVPEVRVRALLEDHRRPGHRQLISSAFDIPQKVSHAIFPGLNRGGGCGNIACDLTRPIEETA